MAESTKAEEMINEGEPMTTKTIDVFDSDGITSAEIAEIVAKTLEYRFITSKIRDTDALKCRITIQPIAPEPAEGTEWKCKCGGLILSRNDNGSCVCESCGTPRAEGTEEKKS